MRLTSEAFDNGKNIPVKYTCYGKNISPPLTIAYIPSDTKSLAFTMQSGRRTYWIWWNAIPDASGSLTIKENSIPAGAILGINRDKKELYRGPCQEPDVRFVFTAYALNEKLDFLRPGSDARVLRQEMEGKIIETAELTALFEGMVEEFK